MNNLELFRIILRFACHQKKNRCFKLADSFSVLCSRCTGNQYGFLFTLIWLFIFYGLSSVSFSIWLIGLMILPVAIDGFTQLFKLRESNNTIRFFSGYLAGSAIATSFFFVFSKVFASGTVVATIPNWNSLLSFLIAPIVFLIFHLGRNSKSFKTFSNGASLFLIFLSILLSLSLGVSVIVKLIFVLL